MDINKIVADLAPFLSAFVAAYLTYLTTKSNNKKSITEREYEYIIKERDRTLKMMTDEIERLIAEKRYVQETEKVLKEQLKSSDDVQEDYQRKIIQLQYAIELLKRDMKNNSNQ